MVKVLTLGAAGVLGSEITRQLESLPDVEQICCDVRGLPYRRKNGTNVKANAREKSQLVPLVKGQDFIICSLNGDWLGMAKALVAAIPEGQDESSCTDHRFEPWHRQSHRRRICQARL